MNAFERAIRNCGRPEPWEEGDDRFRYVTIQIDREDWLACKAALELPPEISTYAVYPGSEKLDLGPARVVARCSSQAQAEVLIKGMWPEFGYWKLEGETK